MSATVTDLARYLRTLAAGRAKDACTDQQLLEQFLTRSEESSFAALVRRHGPMVLGVCRRVLGHDQDAEDAFQATFLVLAKKAGSIRKHTSVSSWLHGVAYHIAERLRAKQARRAAYERKAASRTPIDPGQDVAWNEIRCLLDCELSRLPEHYRSPLVLCYLQGKTQDEAARQLGCSLSTLRRRLDRARVLLAHRLTRRGVCLSAALSATLLADAALQAALPPLLAASTVRVGLASVTGQAMAAAVSAQAAALIENGAGSLLMKKATITIVLLASLALGLGSLLGHRAVQDRTFAKAPAAPPATEPPSRPVRSASKEPAIEIKGRVLDTEGKPLAGARVFLLPKQHPTKPDRPVRATTDQQGRFRFPVRAADFGPQDQVVLAAAAKGFGLDWIDVDAKSKSEEITLRLVADDVPITGRVLDLEGRPVAGVTVDVMRVARTPEGQTLAKWVERHIRDKGGYAWEASLQAIRSDLLDLTEKTTTDAEGKFRLTGFGRDRVLRLKIHGPTIEHLLVWTMTRPGPAKGFVSGDLGFYAANFDLLVGPTKPIIGTVRDKRTGKPLAGMAVEGGWARTVTDAQGRYRLIGVPKKAGYSISAGGGRGRPYFDMTKGAIDTPGLEPLRVDFDLERGIEITGRLIDKATGKPVRGEIHYFPLPFPDNTYVKDFEAFRRLTTVISDWGHTVPDGSFTALGIPGPGVLVACADEENRFAQLEASRELQKLGIWGIPARTVHAVARIDPSVKDSASRKCDISLELARSVTGTVADSDGRPLSGVHVAGLRLPQVQLRRGPATSQGLKTAEFTAQGLSPNRNRAVVFFHPEKKLGKVVRLRGDEKTPFVVHLEALGAVGGRIIDANGEPLAGLQVTVSPDGRLPAKSDAISTDLYQSGLADRMTVRTSTDRDGRFRIAGLLPGMPYLILASEKHGDEEMPVLNPTDLPNLESGKTKDLGDLKSKKISEK
jgi:RNA polymerase sigma factor (sigma-70 family)